MQDQTVFPPEILDEIHFRSQGIPRLINAICDNLLLTAFAMESKVATMEMLDEVTADMRLDYPGQRPFRPQPTYVERVLRESRLASSRNLLGNLQEAKDVSRRKTAPHSPVNVL